MPHVFVDLDGVLGDFVEHTKTLFGACPETLGDEMLWKHVGTTSDFWFGMPLRHDALALWEAVLPFHPTILTGCPRTGYAHASMEKQRWVMKHLGAVKVITCLARDKPMHMHKFGDILIDDYGPHCDRWTRAGGKAILFRDAPTAVAELLSLVSVEPGRA